MPTHASMAHPLVTPHAWGADRSAGATTPQSEQVPSDRCAQRIQQGAARGGRAHVERGRGAGGARARRQPAEALARQRQALGHVVVVQHAALARAAQRLQDAALPGRIRARVRRHYIHPMRPQGCALPRRSPRRMAAHIQLKAIYLAHAVCLHGNPLRRRRARTPGRGQPAASQVPEVEYAAVPAKAAAKAAHLVEGVVVRPEHADARANQQVRRRPDIVVQARGAAALGRPRRAGGHAAHLRDERRRALRLYAGRAVLSAPPWAPRWAEGFQLNSPVPQHMPAQAHAGPLEATPGHARPPPPHTPRGPGAAGAGGRSKRACLGARVRPRRTRQGARVARLLPGRVARHARQSRAACAQHAPRLHVLPVLLAASGLRSTHSGKPAGDRTPQAAHATRDLAADPGCTPCDTRHDTRSAALLTQPHAHVIPGSGAHLAGAPARRAAQPAGQATRGPLARPARRPSAGFCAPRSSRPPRPPRTRGGAGCSSPGSRRPRCSAPT